MRHPGPALLGTVLVAALASLSATTATAFAGPPIPPPPAPVVPVDDPLAPPIGAQPGSATPPCTFTPLRPSEFRLVDAVKGGVSPPVVAPRRPCLRFRSVSSATLQRASGTQLATVFTVPAGAFSGSLSQPAVTGGGEVWATDSGGDGGVFRSVDAGWHWEHRNHGLVSGTDGVLAVAPSRPSTAYLAADEGLYRTDDAGESWHHLTGPVGTTAVSVDPAVPDTVVVPAGADALWVSTDGGLSWTVRPYVQPPLATGSTSGTRTGLCQLVVTHPGHTQLYVQASDCATWWTSSDLGATWRVVNVPVVRGSVVAQGSESPTVMLWAASTGGRLAILATHDGFATTAAVAIPLPAGHSADSVSLQADALGDLFLSYVDTESGRDPVTGDQFSRVWTRTVAFRESAVSPIAASRFPAQGDSTTTPSAPPPISYTPEVRTCQLAAPAGASDPTGGSVYANGSVTFDGRYLDYIDSDGTGSTTLEGGAIYRMDGRCSPAAPLVLRPGDFPGGAVPKLWELTYDSRYVFADGTPGAILAVGSPDTDPALPGGYAPVYAVNPVSGAALRLLGVQLSLRASSSSTCTGGAYSVACGQYPDEQFSYDPFRDALWTLLAQPDGTQQLGLVDMRGVPLPTCMGDFMNQLPGGQQAATVVVGDDGVLYAQLEDDATVLRLDSRRCVATSGFGHRVFAEASLENEQIACDAITFGEGSGRSADSQFSVLWIRDTAQNTVSAYRVPDGYCPFPTDLTYTGAFGAAAGAPVSLCATLRAETAGVRAGLPAEVLHFDLDGRAVGSAVADSRGGACVPALAPPLPGPHAVDVDFLGTHSYFPSHTSGTLVVTGSVPVLGTHRPPPGLVPVTVGLGVPPAPAPGSQVVPGAQVQAQIEAQAQAQAQSQTQAVAQLQAQPAAMLQRRRQEQVATQKATLHPAGVVLQAVTRRSSATAAALVTVAASGMLLALGLVTRAPVPEPARSPLGRHCRVRRPRL